MIRVCEYSDSICLHGCEPGKPCIREKMLPKIPDEGTYEHPKADEPVYDQQRGKP